MTSLPSDPELLLKERIILLDGVIDDERATDVIARMLFLQHAHPSLPITLRINSLGGSVLAGMAIIDTIKELSPPVHTQCAGEAHGIALLVLASGYKGQRLMGRHSLLSLTAPVADGVESENLDRTRRMLVQVLVKCCGQPPEVVNRDMLADRDFDPSAALEYGLVDRIAEEKQR